MLTCRRRPSQRIIPALRLIMAGGAHDTFIATAHQMLGDVLEIESLARIRLADEYDAAQERGELAKHGQKRADVVGGNISSDLGMRRDEIHDARRLRSADRPRCEWQRGYSFGR